MSATIDKEALPATQDGLQHIDTTSFTPTRPNPASADAPFRTSVEVAHAMGGTERQSVKAQLDLHRLADTVALDRYAPPGMLVDESANVLQLRGQVAALLDPGPGVASWKLARVLRKDIANGVLALLRRSVEEDLPVSGTVCGEDAKQMQHAWRVDVLPVFVSEKIHTRFLISFDERQTAAKPALTQLFATASEDQQSEAAEASQQRLDVTRRHLQSLIRQREAQNEELSGILEMALATNQELEARYHQLAATAEQWRAANEEMQTANQVLQQRQTALINAVQGLTDVFSSMNVPMLALSRDLTIRHITPAMQKLAHIAASDVGRNVQEVQLDLQIGNLPSLLHEVLESLTPCEIEVQDRTDCWHLLRIRPYRTGDNRIDGLVLVMMDIDQLRRNRQDLLDGSTFLQSIFESVPVPVVVIRSDTLIHTANIAFRSMTHMRLNALAGRFLSDLLNHLWGVSCLQPLLNALLERGEKFEFEHTSTTADVKTLLIKGQPVRTVNQSAALISLEDVTARRQSEAILQEQRFTLESAVQSTTLKLDRTQQELRSLTVHLFTKQEEERQKVARELHDDISQRLSFLELLLKEVSTVGGDLAPMSSLAEARRHLSTLNTDVRGISHQLHPAILDDLGLSAALRSLVSEFGRREDMVATYISHEVPELPRQPAITAVYRIAQEALRNVAKHAGRTHVKVILEADEHLLRLQVVDLGVGFDQDADEPNSGQGLGMISMIERAHMAHGNLTVRSSLGYGTTVTAEIPFDAET